jgi:hypothetical protein
MAKKREKNKQPTRFLGTYTWPDGHSVVGELNLKGSNTLLKVHSNEFLARMEAASSIKGTAYTGECLTLIDRHSPGIAHTTFKDAPTRYHVDVFPHYVAIRQRHIEPGQLSVRGIHFTTTDLTTLFYDFDAFSHVIDAKPIIDLVLQERRQLRPVEAGEWPQVFYFTGKDCIVDVPTALGKVSVHHRDATLPREEFSCSGSQQHSQTHPRTRRAPAGTPTIGNEIGRAGGVVNSRHVGSQRGARVDPN